LQVTESVILAGEIDAELDVFRIGSHQLFARVDGPTVVNDCLVGVAG